ncbi:MAG: nicotinamide riboside transporter PnuC [Kangiellaceae bacterium]|nr:nicotinamide riboside transporter PnuC [Kangiellaceae bacterium]
MDIDFFVEQLLSQWLSQTLLEMIAVLCSVAYVTLAARANKWCWPFAFASTAIFSYVFFDVKLTQEALLNVYYLLMAIYGWYAWSKQSSPTKSPDVVEKVSDRDSLIQSWSLATHIRLIFFIVMVGIVSGLLFEIYFDAEFSLLNGISSWLAVLTTYLVTQKVLENWYYWMVINSLSLYMFASLELYVTALLMLIYLAMSIYGINEWQRLFKQQQLKSQ